MQRLLNVGVLRPQQFDATNYQLALDQGEDPNDPASILHVGSSDIAAGLDLATTKRKKGKKGRR